LDDSLENTISHFYLSYIASCSTPILSFQLGSFHLHGLDFVLLDYYFLIIKGHHYYYYSCVVISIVHPYSYFLLMASLVPPSETNCH
jgi:hypothetical protein